MRLLKLLATTALLLAVPASAQLSSLSNPPVGGSSGTVTSVSVTTANGVSGTVANPTTTPAISVSLGSITPSSVSASGTVTGSNLSGTNTGDQTITLSGDASGSGTGAVAVTISGLSLSKLAAISNNTILGNVSGSSAAPSALTTLPTAALPALTGGDVTSSAGSTTLTIGASRVTTTMMANLAASSLLGNATGSPAAPSAVGLGPSFTFSGSTMYGASDHPGYISGNWYSTIRGATGAAGATFTANNIKLLPFTISKPITISALGARVTTLASSGNFQLAIYANNAATGRPTGNALCTTGNISSNATGAVSAAATCGAGLTPGTYWEGINQDNGTAVFQTLGGSEAQGAYLIGSTTLANITPGGSLLSYSLSVSQTFGTWPDLTSASFTEATSTNSALVFMKAQ